VTQTIPIVRCTGFHCRFLHFAFCRSISIFSFFIFRVFLFSNFSFHPFSLIFIFFITYFLPRSSLSSFHFTLFPFFLLSSLTYFPFLFVHLSCIPLLFIYFTLFSWLLHLAFLSFSCSSLSCVFFFYLLNLFALTTVFPKRQSFPKIPPSPAGITAVHKLLSQVATSKLTLSFRRHVRWCLCLLPSGSSMPIASMRGPVHS
jgi:hypothetical protein